MNIVLFISATLLALLGLLVLAAFTNWFRYPLTLEATTVVVPVLMVVVIGGGLHVWSVRAAVANTFAAWAAVASLFIAAGTTVLLTKRAFGQWLPALASADTDRNDDQLIYGSDGAAIVYHLELHNPFARSAKTYLVGSAYGRRFKVTLPIGRVPAYGEAVTPSDWVTLTATSRPGVFVATVTVDPARTHVFAVNLHDETAAAINQ